MTARPVTRNSIFHKTPVATLTGKRFLATFPSESGSFGISFAARRTLLAWPVAFSKIAVEHASFIRFCFALSTATKAASPRLRSFYSRSRAGAVQISKNPRLLCPFGFPACYSRTPRLRRGAAALAWKIYENQAGAFPCAAIT